ncbi:hypothetical protein ABZX12_40675 [Kribbella sp. NPDC003505]|uniref:hypothetical protein n=1 Tax=Kribbella sp. NPDC003505 TaxID=3154448 RepID=UPI00339E1242
MGRSYTTTVDSASLLWNRSSSCAARVDSALLGKKVVASLFWTSVNFWEYAEVPTRTTIQIAATTHFHRRWDTTDHSELSTA